MEVSAGGNHDVFISYSTKNKNVADAVVADFEQNGIKCWYAPRDILPGEEWVTAITKALEGSKALVLIYTDESNNSRQVMNEIAVAFNAGITIVPFRLSNEQMSSELEYYLTRVHWLDAVSKPLKKNIAALREYIRVIINAQKEEGPDNYAGGEGATAHGPRSRGDAVVRVTEPAPPRALTMVLITCGIIALVTIIVLIVLPAKKGDDEGTEPYYVQSDFTEETLSIEEGNGGEEEYRIGLSYFSDEDYEEALSHFEKAADLGSKEASLALGDMYYSGEGVEMDEEKAKEYYLAAAGYVEDGGMIIEESEGIKDEDMINRLGLIYFYDGEYEKAAVFFTMIADECNSVNGMGNAGMAYENLGDWEMAVNYYGMAIDAGHRDAEKFRKKLKGFAEAGYVSEDHIEGWM